MASQPDVGAWILVVIAVASAACISAAVLAASTGSVWPVPRRRRPKLGGRVTRILIGALLPAPLGLLLLFVLSSASAANADVHEVLMLIFSAYLLVGAQSILMSLLMELWVNPRTERHDVAVAVAAVLGAISLPISAGAVSVGVIVGATVGGIMRWFWVRAIEAGAAA